MGLKPISEGNTTSNKRIIALAGNPNVGKSTLFNSLTGMHQHTGNWPGKTVSNATGHYYRDEKEYIIVDLPGAYSLVPHSTEEEIARDFICFGDADAVIIVCDATCLERNLNLVLQILEITDRAVICLNLMDEAKRKGISIDTNTLSKLLHSPVVPIVARKKKGLEELIDQVGQTSSGHRKNGVRKTTKYPSLIEEAIALIEPAIARKWGNKISSRWVSLRLLAGEEKTPDLIAKYLGEDLLVNEDISQRIKAAKEHLEAQRLSPADIENAIVNSLVGEAEDICREVVSTKIKEYNTIDRKIDRIITSKKAGYPLMFGLLALVFWLTISGANYPSQMIAHALFWFQDQLTIAFNALGSPDWLHGILVLGVYRVLAWVVSVMLPPMAIFFPLFTLLEDAGYLPRVAYNLDKHFQRCNACGKQALTMCMGFGCNAAGVIGCRIIDSKRERLIAIITNNFVPCNGRFPTLIAIITMFFIGINVGFFSTLLSAILLTTVIVLGIAMTFLASKILSATILKGEPSSFTLELPPYRRPQLGQVIVRSIFDRTLFVLARAVKVAAPAGLIIWIMANVDINGISMLNHCSGFLDPFASLLGLDGVILLAFIIGFPANEIVLPIIIMAYLSSGSILELDSLASLKQLLVDNGWTWITACCTMLFSLIHWPCSTTCLTIKKETQSWKWTAYSFIIPTIMGMLTCFVFANIARLFT